MSIYARRMMMGASDKKYTFGGVEISPGPVYYDGSTFKMVSNWYEKEYISGMQGLNTNSIYFTIPNLATYFDSTGSSFPNNRSVDNANTLSGWRMPTEAEIKLWYGGTSRTTASVNGSAGRYYSRVLINDKTYNGAYPYGIIFYPDASSQPSITASFINQYNVTNNYNSITEAQLNSLLEQGCVFFPATGYLSNASSTSLNNKDSVFRYWTCSNYNGTQFWALNLYGASYLSESVLGGDTFYPCRLVKSI